MNWNIKSKRFIVVAVINGVWIAALAINHELFRFLTPWVIGFNGGYVIGESWRPSGNA